MTLHPVPLSAKYPGAAVPGSLQRACSADKQQIGAYFSQKGFPFSSALVREMDGSLCHIAYEPALPGFQAAAEDDAVSSLYFNIDPLPFLAGRTEPVGDSLDIATAILAQSPRRLEVTLALGALPSEQLFREAVRRHFGTPPHAIHSHHAPANGEHAPWMQDFLKPGRRGRQEHILVTRRAFEGVADHAARLDSVLDSFRAPVFERSNLSWEGGDLQFARHPKDDNKLVMFYGTSMKQYWGESLTREELEYVLRREFGADEAVYLDDVTPHADYLLSLLPERQTALVAKPVCGDLRVARAALDVLLHHHAGAAPTELQRLDSLLPAHGTMPHPPAELREALENAAAARKHWKAPRNTGVESRVLSFVQANCPGDPAACVAAERLPQLLDQQPALLRDWVDAGGSIRLANLLNQRMLELMESQTSGCADLAAKADLAAAHVARLGFRVIRIPWLPASAENRQEWAGISYANAARIDETLFVPAFGLEPVEKEWFAQLRSELPSGYKLVPVPARFLLLENGGLHCAIAFGRQPAAHEPDHAGPTGAFD
ncbi:MAG: agmatine deiminase family protein [Bryobacterales bacterium]|nr:agmatine deiminase family protein [Bryobacterales bacterium]